MSETISRAEAIRLARANRARVEAVMRAEVERDPGSEEVSVEELQARIAELEEAADVRARMMDRARALYQKAHPRTEDRWPDGAATVVRMVEHLEAVTRERDEQFQCVCDLEVQTGEQARTMRAAAAEIEEHWAAHCDATGAGPVNLIQRLRVGRGACYSGYCASLDAARAEGWDAGAEDALRWAFRDGSDDDDAIARYRAQREGER